MAPDLDLFLDVEGLDLGFSDFLLVLSGFHRHD